MRKFSLLLTLLVFTSLCNFLFAQIPNWLWAKSAGGSKYDIATSVVTDASGNSYVTGYFESPVISFGTDTLTNAGGYDIFLAKYNINGNLQWAKSAGGKYWDKANSIALDSSGNIYVTGCFQSDTLIFGSTTLIDKGGYNIFLVKYDNNGNVIWAKSAGGTGNDYATSVAVDASGNVLLTGNYSSPSINFGNSILMNTGYNDIFLAKYDANGNVLWAISEGGGDDDYASSVAVDTLGNTYLAGYFYSPSIKFGSTILINEAGNNVFLAKFDSNGNVLWAKSAGETTIGQVSSVAVDASGNAYLTGYYSSSTISFDIITLTNTNVLFNDIFLVKYDANGNTLWARNAGGVDDDKAYAVAVDASGNAYLTGYFNSPTITFGSTTITNGGIYNIFLSKYSTDGNLIWANRLGGNNDDVANSIALDATGNIFVTGDFLSDTICFGSDTLKNVGATDIFIAKASSSTGMYELKNSLNISVFPNPATNNITIDAGNLRSKSYDLRVYDVIGNMVLEKNFNNKTTIDISSFPCGVYVGEVRDEKGVAVEKFVKE
ncbi:MAG: SBBP repeat-containing protein [Bacteroidales bacterium]